MKLRISNHIVRTRFGLVYTLASVAGVVMVVSLVQSSHGYEAYAVSPPSAGTKYGSGYVVRESSGPSGANSTGDAAKNNAQSSGSAPVSKAGANDNATNAGAASTSASIAGASAKQPAASPSPAPAPSAGYKYPLHSGIKTTWFYAGEPASADNGFIQNVSSAWQENWQNYFGGSDDPTNRCGYNPCAFTPHENPFYFALPFSDYTNAGPVRDLSMVYWNPGGQLRDGDSILKNRWIQMSSLGKTVYAQWEDVGPFNEHDGAYVFGSSAPASTRAGLDVSPAVRDYIGMGGSTTSSWRFVDYSEVPGGPWKNIITTSAPDWN